MNEFRVNPQDERLQNIQRDDFDCFTFDSLSISELKRILKGKSVLLNRFLMNETESELKHKEKHILSKVRLIDNIVKNDPYTKAFLVFQTITWKLLKQKMPFILIPVRIFNEGTKVIRDGEPFVNPLLENHIGYFEDIVADRDLFSLDNSELSERIQDNNGRLIYDMYLTHFKVSFASNKKRTNKRFVTIDHPIDYLEKNNDLIPMDLELINIKKSVLSGNNTLLNAKQGTKKVALLVNIISEFVARNQSVLYVSEKNYRSLRDAIRQTGLSEHVEDVLDTEYENEFDETVENHMPFEQLKDIVEMLYDYQDNLTEEQKGSTLADAFAELILLRDMPQKEGVVEFFDELTEQDVQNILETLRKLQTILDNEQYIVPADLHWNDVDVRSVKYKEAETVKEINGIRVLLEEIQLIIKQVRSEYGILLPTTYNEITKHVKNLDYMNSLQYPSSWFEGDAFKNAKKHINSANNVAGRTLSLDTTINMTYKKRIKKVDTEEILSSLYGNYFDESQHKVMNKLLISKNYSRNEIEKLEVVVERLLFYKEQYENMWSISFEKDFSTFVLELSSLLSNKLLKLEWLNYSDEQKNEILTSLKQHDEVVTKYLQVKRDALLYFNESVLDLEVEFIDSYIKQLEENAKKSPEVQSVYRVVDQYAQTRFAPVRKTRKIQILNKVRDYLSLTPVVEEVRKDISKLISKKIKIVEYRKYLSLFEKIVEFENPYELVFKIDRKKTADMLKEFKENLSSYNYLMKDSLFNSMSELSIEELEIEVDKFRSQAYQLMEVEDEVRKFFKKTPEYLTVQEIRTVMRTVQNYQINSRQLEERNDDYALWYGDSYTGMTTAFKGVRIMLKNFDKFLSIFRSDESAVEYFKKREYKKVNELLYSLRMKLYSLEELVEDINRFFVQPVVMNELHLLDSYLSQFASHKHMVQWVEFVEGLQSLRNYNQLRLAALINNGELVNNIGEQFKYAFYEKLIETYYKGYDSTDIVGSMKTFNDQNKLVHKQRILDIRSRRRKKVVLSSVSGMDENRSTYDLVIVDGAERIHSSYMQKLFSMGRTTVVLFDEDSATMDDSIYNYINHQPMYNIEHNYRISPYLIEEEDLGVLFDQKVEITNRMPVIDKVITTLTETDQRVNVVCHNNNERVEIYNLINTRISKLTENQEEVLSRLYVLLYNEYIPSTDITYLLLNEYHMAGAKEAIQASLKNSRNLIILDEADYLSTLSTFNELNKDLMDLLNGELEPISEHVVKALDLPYQVKRMIPPYDFVVGEGNDFYCLVKITFNNDLKSDILEETQMLFDEEYASYNKFVIGIDDLYFRHDEVINRLKEVIKRGSSK